MFSKTFPLFALLVMSAGYARCDDVFINEIIYHPLSENPLEEYH